VAYNTQVPESLVERVGFLGIFCKRSEIKFKKLPAQDLALYAKVLKF